MSSSSECSDCDGEDCLTAGTGVVAAIAVVVTLLVSLPVCVTLGCYGMWYIMMRRSATSGQKVTQLQAAIYEEPVVEPATIPLTDNQAYGHVKTSMRS